MKPLLRLLVAHYSAKKCLDLFGDEVPLFFQGKVPRIEQVKVSFWQITLICFCSLDCEERIVLSPQDQGARLAGTEVLVPSVVEREVGGIIMEQVELDRVISRAIEEDLVKRPIVPFNSLSSTEFSDSGNSEPTPLNQAALKGSQMRTTILPLAWFDSIASCASRISSN